MSRLSIAARFKLVLRSVERGARNVLHDDILGLFVILIGLTIIVRIEGGWAKCPALAKTMAFIPSVRYTSTPHFSRRKI